MRSPDSVFSHDDPVTAGNYLLQLGLNKLVQAPNMMASFAVTSCIQPEAWLDLFVNLSLGNDPLDSLASAGHQPSKHGGILGRMQAVDPESAHWYPDTQGPLTDPTYVALIGQRDLAASIQAAPSDESWCNHPENAITMQSQHSGATGVLSRGCAPGGNRAAWLQWRRRASADDSPGAACRTEGSNCGGADRIARVR